MLSPQKIRVDRNKLVYGKYSILLNIVRYELVPVPVPIVITIKNLRPVLRSRWSPNYFAEPEPYLAISAPAPWLQIRNRYLVYLIFWLILHRVPVPYR